MRTISPNEYQLNLALIEEYKAALKAKRKYEALFEEFAGFAEEFIAYCEAKGVNPALDPRLCRAVRRLKVLLSDESYHRKQTDENLPEP